MVVLCENEGASLGRVRPRGDRVSALGASMQDIRLRCAGLQKPGLANVGVYVLRTSTVRGSARGPKTRLLPIVISHVWISLGLAC